MSKPIIFISYSHEDEEWKDRLVTHLGVLRHQGLLDLWDDRRIGAGEDWYQEIQEAMATASVAVLLVSANFLTSKFILSEEVPRLLERREKEGLHIIPIIVKPCAWKQVKWLARMQVRPKDGRALSAGDEYQIDTALTAIAEEVAAIIDHVARLPKNLLNFAFAQQLTEEYDTALGKRVLVKRGREFDPPVSSPSLDWRFPHYELAVRLHPESFIYVEVLDKKGEKHKLLYSSAILFGLNRWGELHVPLDKDISETWHSLMIDLPEHIKQAHWPGFVKVNWLSLRGEVKLAEIRGCTDKDSLMESAKTSIYIARFPVLQMSRLPQILLDFASAPPLGDWENNSSLTLEYDTTLGKRVLVKEGHGFDPPVTYHPQLDWRFPHYELVVRLHSGSFIYINVLDETDKNRTLLYSSTIPPGPNKQEEFMIPLDKGISDGNWRSLMIDLPEHMKQAHWPGFVKVNWLCLRGEMVLAGIRGCDDKDPLIESAIASKYDVHFPILAVNDTFRPDSAPSSKDPATFVPYIISSNRIDLVDAHVLSDAVKSPQHGRELILWLSVENPDKASAIIEEIGPQLLVSLSDSPQDVRNLFLDLEVQSPFVGKLLASKTTLRFALCMSESPGDWKETQSVLQRLQVETKGEDETVLNLELEVLYDFFDHFVEADRSDYGKKKHCVIKFDKALVSGGVTKRGIFQHPPLPEHCPSRLPYPPIRIPDHIQELWLDFSIGILDKRPDTEEQQDKSSRKPFRGDAKFNVRINTEVKLDERLNSVGWFCRSLPITLPIDGELTVEFLTDVTGADLRYKWAAWGEPRLLGIRAVQKEWRKKGVGLADTSERQAILAEKKAQIFLSYAREDEERVENLYQQLSEEGFNPWMAKKDLVGGEKWESRISQAIRRSDFVVVCLSVTSVNKRSFIQKEIKHALDIWQEKLESDIYLIPVRLEDCKVPESLRKFHWVNLFEEDGWTRLVKAIQEGMKRRVKTLFESITPSRTPPPTTRRSMARIGDTIPEVGLGKEDLSMTLIGWAESGIAVKGPYIGKLHTFTARLRMKFIILEFEFHNNWVREQTTPDFNKGEVRTDKGYFYQVWSPLGGIHAEEYAPRPSTQEEVENLGGSGAFKGLLPGKSVRRHVVFEIPEDEEPEEVELSQVPVSIKLN